MGSVPNPDELPRCLHGELASKHCTLAKTNFMRLKWQSNDWMTMYTDTKWLANICSVVVQ